MSVIIPTFDRYPYLLNAVDSVRAQTHTEVEILVVNDASTQAEYYDGSLGTDVKLIHLAALEPGARRTPGARARNAGLAAASGDFVAFLDDDDVWLPHKLSVQLEAMRETGCEMSCTEGLIGEGVFNRARVYPRYNAERYLGQIQSIHRRKGSRLMDEGFPRIWARRFLEVHNSAVCSSVVLSRAVVEQTGAFRPLPAGVDYDYWLRALVHTDCVYVDEPCFYYDNHHGGGRRY